MQALFAGSACVHIPDKKIIFHRCRSPSLPGPG
nr:MAG TPA: hypothetical protein [Caudoviricetes sp.]